ncbi:hypothetical protein DFA_07581 [Cavenderia fasciculata]|uniref:Uncharacterized protein n=1 Tax=Cavenderia fasciculata TaxID=261658 RepID=F4PWU3_CACFS|nr:uncharacterized protein DFA_07581 [Cavenderia fasciculata]EGG20457.1 hypothetical protein DFA_07581 [Cavenderia fasciculata]|eukprot:XP_004367440.1 hypothetical protein DFA_07581 [Cavenderia fasciculata]
MALNSVEKITLKTDSIQPSILKIFKNIKSITINNSFKRKTYDNTLVRFIFNSLKCFLTSINLLDYQTASSTSDSFLEAINKSTTVGIVKLLFPRDWCKDPIVLDTRLANNIVNSIILPPQQMPNLRIFHIIDIPHGRFDLAGTKLTKLVYQENVDFQRLIIATSICPIHKDRAPHTGTYGGRHILQFINRL